MAVPTKATVDAYNAMHAIITFMVDNGMVATAADEGRVADSAQSDSVGGTITLPSGISLARYDISDNACTITFTPVATKSFRGRKYAVTAQA